MNYEISFKTIQKYCIHKKHNLSRTSRYKYRCDNIKLIWGRDWDINKASRCAEANCPLVKRLYGYEGGII